MESLAVPALKAVQVAPHPDLGAEETTVLLVPVMMTTVLVFVGMMSVLGVRHGLVEMMIGLLVPVVMTTVLVFVGMMSVLLVPVVTMTVHVFVGMMIDLGVRHGLVEMMIVLLVPVVMMTVLVFVGMMSVRHVRGVTMPARVVPVPLRSNVRTKFDTRAAVAA